ncbi:unnamed protein product [Malus baccata var. baccata]|uniref:Uncharacterized protein n=1 Tax=Malus baccata TaxID=106549 RepID=A0A540L0Y6_MALBA|nr:hypothetical protein C1H46_034327 [Malus baccata]
MGRAPCCDKANVKRGPWSPEEDAKLKSYIEQHGTGGNWIALPQKIGLKRCGKSCRLRWLNYLRPNIRHGGFSEEEDNIICSLYISIGSRWSIIAAQLPGRTDNDIKNYWNTRLKKKLLGRQRKEHQLARKSGLVKQDIIKRSGGVGGNSTNSHSAVPATDDQNPYWPELPVLAAPTVLPQQQQQPCFNDHASLRKLLIKLGGRFSSDINHNHETNQVIQGRPTNIQPTYQVLDDDNNSSYAAAAATTQQMDEHYSGKNMQSLLIPRCGIHALNNSSPSLSNNDVISPHQFAQTHYIVNTDNIDGPGNGIMNNMFQGQGGDYETDQLKEMAVYNNNDNQQRFDGLEFFCGEEMMVMNNRITSSYGESIGWGEMLGCPPVASSSDDYHDSMDRLMPAAPGQECGFANDQLMSGYPGEAL